MIPKIIHYCWFGRGKKNDLFYQCLKSWKKYFPDFKIIEWNEDNFNVNQNAYAKEAYEAKKYAFVSDYARIKIIYDYGGIYFDTDVEVLKDMHGILQKGAYIGCELFGQVQTGLGFAAEPHNMMVGRMLEQYNNLHFKLSNGYNMVPCGKYNTKPFFEDGWSGINEITKIKDMNIYPTEYFAPFNYLTGEVKITSNTYTYHHGNASWLPDYERNLFQLKKKLVKKFGQKIGKIIYYIIKFFVLLFKNPKKLFRKRK